MTEQHIRDAMRAVQEASLVGVKPGKGKTGKDKTGKKKQGATKASKAEAALIAKALKTANKTLRKATPATASARCPSSPRSSTAGSASSANHPSSSPCETWRLAMR